VSHTPRRWIAVIVASVAVAAVPAIAPPLSPREVRVVDDVNVTLAASWSPEQQAVLDDFSRGGLAEVLRVQGTSRLTQPDQVQIINDFFEGGVLQTEGRRWISLFADPQQQQFLTDVLAGGVVQVVRNRLLDSTTDPGARAAIIAIFPDEITDYRGGPITMLQRRLIAAAKGNPFVIGLVNAVFDNPVVLTIRRLIGGGPIIGTPLPDLPPTDQPVNSSVPVETSTPAVTDTVAPAVEKKAETVAVAATRSPAEAATDPSAEAAPVPEVAEPDTEPATKTANAPESETETDVVKTGNKVEPTTLAGPGRTRPAGGGFGVFGQVADAITAGLAGLAGAYNTPAPTADSGAATGTDTSPSGSEGSTQ
jgi:hypothetical protein